MTAPEHPHAAYYDRDAVRIELLWIDRPSRDVYGEHTKVASLTTYCAGLEPVTVELARDAALALGKALIEAWISYPVTAPTSPRAAS